MFAQLQTVGRQYFVVKSTTRRVAREHNCLKFGRSRINHSRKLCIGHSFDTFKRKLNSKRGLDVSTDTIR